MKKKFGIFFLFVLFFSISFFNPGQLLASGSYDCGWDTAASECVVAVDNCAWNPPSDCQFANNDYCSGIKSELQCNGTAHKNLDCNDITGSDECDSGGPPPDLPGCLPTAIGCINVGSPEDFVESVLALSLGIGGGIAFLLMIFGSIQVLVSGGVPERVKSGRDLITAALSGLLLIIFAVFALRLIGYDLLKLPGFSP